MKLKGLVLLAFAVSLLELLVLTLDIRIYDLLQQQNVHTAISRFRRLNSSLVERSLNKKGYSISDLPPKPALWTDKIHQNGSFNSSLVERSLNKKGYSISDLPPKPALWTDKIYLCINFNLNNVNPGKQVTETLLSYYLPFFKNITLIFNGDNWSRPDYVPEFVDVISCDSHRGWYQHKCIRSCIQRGSEETKGFLYIADDMFINLTKMAELPTTKLWSVGSYATTHQYRFQATKVANGTGGILRPMEQRT